VKSARALEKAAFFSMSHTVRVFNTAETPHFPESDACEFEVVAMLSAPMQHENSQEHDGDVDAVDAYPVKRKKKRSSRRKGAVEAVVVAGEDDVVPEEDSGVCEDAGAIALQPDSPVLETSGGAEDCDDDDDDDTRAEGSEEAVYPRALKNRKKKKRKSQERSGVVCDFPENTVAGSAYAHNPAVSVDARGARCEV